MELDRISIWKAEQPVAHDASSLPDHGAEAPIWTYGFKPSVVPTQSFLSAPRVQISGIHSSVSFTLFTCFHVHIFRIPMQDVTKTESQATPTGWDYDHFSGAAGWRRGICAGRLQGMVGFRRVIAGSLDDDEAVQTTFVDYRNSELRKINKLEFDEGSGRLLARLILKNQWAIIEFA